MDNTHPTTSNAKLNTAPSVNPPDNDCKKTRAPSRKTGKSGRRQVRSTAPAQTHQLILKKMISEVDALGNFMKYSFQTYNPDASEEQGELLRDIDTEQLMKRIKKCNDLHQQCVRAMPTSPNVATLERLMDATDYYEKFRKNFYKKVNKISDSISRQIARELYYESRNSDEETDDIAKNLLEEVSQEDKSEPVHILKRVLKCAFVLVDSTENSLKIKDQFDQKLYSKWCEMFANSLSMVLDLDQGLDPELLSLIKTVMTVFHKTASGQDYSMYLLAVLKQLNKYGILDPKTSSTGKEIIAGHIIKACIAQLGNLNIIIGSKAQKGESFTLELRQKDKLVSQLHALRPYLSEGDLYNVFIPALVVDNVDHNWFALLYALAHCPAEALSDPQREKFSQRLEQYHPQARAMFDALLTGNHVQVPDLTTTNYTVLWLKAFILNKQREHRRAYEAISESESSCLALGLKKPDVRLQLEILRIKLKSQLLGAELPLLSLEELKVMKGQADSLITHPQAFWTQDEHTLLEQIRKILVPVLLELTPTVIEPVIPASVRTVEDAPEECDTLNAEADVAMIAMPLGRKYLVKELCKNLMAELRGWQVSNRPEPLTPDDSYQVMGPYGKTLSATETMQKDYWNSGIRQLLAEVSAHRADGDIIRELSCYQSILGDATRKRTIGIYRLTLELSWTIMRYVNGEYGAADLTDSEKGELLDLSWQFLKQSICLAMRRSSPLPEQASDEELVETIVQWLQCLKAPLAKQEMEFFMRCALGSTAGHIHGFLAEIFPAQQQHSDRARFFFKAKPRLQPDYQKTVDEEGRDTRQRLMGQNQQERWSRGY